MLTVKNGAVDPKVEEEGGEDEERNRGCAWLRMNAKNKVERQEIEEKIKYNFSFRNRANAQYHSSCRRFELFSAGSFSTLTLGPKFTSDMQKNNDMGKPKTHFFAGKPPSRTLLDTNFQT